MVYVFLGTGFEETEAIVPIDLLRRAGIGVISVGLNGQTILGSHNIPVTADIRIEELDMRDADMIVLPGGLRGVAFIRGCKKAMDIVCRAYTSGKFVAAVCAAPTILASLHITDGRRAVCYPGCESEMGSTEMVQDACVRDGNVITGASAGCAVPFALELIRALKGEDAAKNVASQIVIR